MSVENRIDQMVAACKRANEELAPLRHQIPMTWPLIRELMVDVEQNLTLARTRVELGRDCSDAMVRIVKRLDVLRAILRACSSEGERRIMESIHWPNEPNKIAIAVLGSTGDTKSIWDKNQADEVQAARDQFDKLKKKGYLAFQVNKDGTKGDQMRTFDPDAERMIMVPPMQGG